MLYNPIKTPIRKSLIYLLKQMMNVPRKLTNGSQTPLVQIARKHLGEQRSVHIRNPSEDSQHAVK